MTDLLAALESASEVWLPIAGFEGLYEVSDLGRVRSLKGRHGQGKVLAPKLPDYKHQYKAVSLHKNGKRSRRHVHRLVADAFIGPRPHPDSQMRHLNGDRGDNRATNLKWGTALENASDRTKHGRSLAGVRHTQAKLTNADVRRIRALAYTMSQRKLAAKFGVSQKTVWRIIHRGNWQCVK